jgi:hypothetical protein
MKFTLEIDLDALTGNTEEEVGRILRYWGGSMKQLELAEGDAQDLYDSAYAKVGQWSVTA